MNLCTTCSQFSSLDMSRLSVILRRLPVRTLSGGNPFRNAKDVICVQVCKTFGLFAIAWQRRHAAERTVFLTWRHRVPFLLLPPWLLICDSLFRCSPRPDSTTPPGVTGLRRSSKWNRLLHDPLGTDREAGTTIADHYSSAGMGNCSMLVVSLISLGMWFSQDTDGCLAD